MSKTQAEFSPDFFRSLFGAAPEEWKGFLEVSVRAMEEARSKLNQAMEAEDATALSETRHSIGPSLTQWGATSLESGLRELTPDQKAIWTSLSGEFDALLGCLKRLQSEP